MKRISLIIVGAMLCANVEAQYKKASFLNRGHKNYGLTTGMKLFTDGVKPAPNFNFTYGNDKGKNRIFHWWDLDYTLGSGYSYTSAATPSGNVKVDGKAGGYLSIGYNWAVYVLDNKNEDNKLLPFLTLGLNTTIVGRKYISETVTPSNLNPDKFTYYSGSFGFNAGAGVVYKISEKTGFFGNAGYRFEETGAANNAFALISTHPYINAGIRVLIKSEDD
jgi:hypothetical protein